MFPPGGGGVLVGELAQILRYPEHDDVPGGYLHRT